MKLKLKRTDVYDSTQIDQDFLKDNCKKFLNEEVKEYEGTDFNPTNFVSEILRKNDNKLVFLLPF